MSYQILLNRFQGSWIQEGPKGLEEISGLLVVVCIHVRSPVD